MYRYLKSLRGSSNSKSFIGTSGEVICKAVVIAAAFNEYFHSILSQSSFVLPHISSLPQPESTLSSISIDSGDVFEVLRSLDEKQNHGLWWREPQDFKTLCNFIM